MGEELAREREVGDTGGWGAQSQGALREDVITPISARNLGCSVGKPDLSLSLPLKKNKRGRASVLCSKGGVTWELVRKKSQGHSRPSDSESAF